MVRARGRDNEGQPISLFPFLDIVACLIGTLTLMITTMAIGQMDTADFKRVEEYEQQEKALAELQETNTELNRQRATLIKSASSTQRRLAELRRQLAVRQRQLEAATRDVPTVGPAPKIDPNIQTEIAERTAELKPLQDEISRLLAEIARRKKPPEAATAVIQPSGSGTDLEPTFVECARDGIYLHTQDPPHFVRGKDIATNSHYMALLERIAQSEKETVIFLVREKGIGRFRAAEWAARQKRARNGKLPVPGEGKIDLSLFR